MTVQIEVDGLAPFINRLEKFDKDVSKVLKKEMRAAADQVAKNARGRVRQPLSNWGRWVDSDSGRDLGFNAGAVAKGFRVQTNRYRRRGATTGFGYDVVQGNAAGNIFEVVGSKSRIRGAKGAQFVDSIVARFSGTTPRTLIPAYYAEIEGVHARIEEAIRNAEREVGL